MKNLTVIDDSENTSLSCAESFIKYTKEDLNDIKISFFKIGFRLNEAEEFKYYEALGYADIFELAEAEFGFKKTTTKNLMAVNRRYCVHNQGGSYISYTMQIDPRYDKYNQTQLVEMLPLTAWQVENVPADFKESELKDYKKIVDCKTQNYLRLGLLGNAEVAKDPRKYVEKYRELKTKVPAPIKTTSKTAPAPEDIPAGQLYLGADESITEFHQSGAEQFSQSTDQCAEFAQMFEESQSTDCAEDAINEPVQEIAPEPKKLTFKNRGEREAFIDNKDNFPILVLENEELGLTVRRLDFINGVKLYRSEHVEFGEYTRRFNTIVKFHLVDDREKSKPLKKANVMPYCGMTFTLAGTARTYVVDYMTRYANEI
ncbi:MAG: hypothetical protein IJC72_00330 [Clostridia bacterium]|nr:hypothetical protein [Clostridia bacterium]